MEESSSFANTSNVLDTILPVIMKNIFLDLLKRIRFYKNLILNYVILYIDSLEKNNNCIQKHGFMYYMQAQY